jgi:hypothetical protein
MNNTKTKLNIEEIKLENDKKEMILNQNKDLKMMILKMFHVIQKYENEESKKSAFLYVIY